MSNILIEETEIGLWQGEPVKSYKLKNKLTDFSLTVISYGARIQSIHVKDKNNDLIDVACGYDKLEEYTDASLNAYFGCTVGRVANRISNAEFKLNGKLFKLEKNNGNACLHGGINGISNRNWSSDILDDGVRFTYLSPDGEEGFPGVVTIEATYRLDPNANNIIIEYNAIAEELTPVNLTNHNYFNLTPGKKIYDHLVKINADKILDMNPDSTFTGKLNKVDGTKYDLRDFVRLGNRMKDKEWPHEGFDHFFVFNQECGKTETKLVASIKSPINGLKLDIYSNDKGLQFYTGNFFDLKTPTKSFQRHEGFAMEPSNYPDSVNHEHFPSCLLGPDEEYYQKMIFSFSLEN